MYVEAHRSGRSGESDTVVARLEVRRNNVVLRIKAVCWQLEAFDKIDIGARCVDWKDVGRQNGVRKRCPRGERAVGQLEAMPSI
jgi:hypothetical protein